MISTDKKIHSIIHLASASAAAVGGGLAQVPGSDAPVIVGLQTAMITAIAAEHGIPLSQSAAAQLLLTFSAATAGRTISQLVIGWVPGLGNAINATTAAGITQAIGWTANTYFKNPPKQLT